MRWKSNQDSTCFSIEFVIITFYTETVTGKFDIIIGKSASISSRNFSVEMVIFYEKLRKRDICYYFAKIFP